MGDILPTFATIFASSTANTVSFFGYLFPIIPLAFAVVVVVAAINLVIRLIQWLAAKISGNSEHSGMTHGWRYNDQKNTWDRIGSYPKK